MYLEIELVHSKCLIIYFKFYLGLNYFFNLLEYSSNYFDTNKIFNLFIHSYHLDECI
jgi:hypothetical protein